MWHWGWWNTIYRTWSPQQRKILRKFGSSLSLSNTWRHSSLFLSTSCKLPIKLASLSLLSVSDSVSVSVSVSIEISDSDSDENPLWIFSSSSRTTACCHVFWTHCFQILNCKVTFNDLGNQQNKRNMIYDVFKQNIWQEVTSIHKAMIVASHPQLQSHDCGFL